MLFIKEAEKEKKVNEIVNRLKNAYKAIRHGDKAPSDNLPASQQQTQMAPPEDYMSQFNKYFPNQNPLAMGGGAAAAGLGGLWALKRLVERPQVDQYGQPVPQQRSALRTLLPYLLLGGGASALLAGNRGLDWRKLLNTAKEGLPQINTGVSQATQTV